MKLENNHLITALLHQTEKSIASALHFKSLSLAQLNFKNSSQQWSILQCLAHLNLYGDFYLTKIEDQILKQKINTNKQLFKSGMLGNYFVNMMKVKPNQIKKYKAMKRMTAENETLSITTVDRFLKQQELFNTLLKQCRNIDLNTPRIETALSGLIKLNMGDTLRFLAYHTERHILQAESMLITTPHEI